MKLTIFVSKSKRLLKTVSNRRLIQWGEQYLFHPTFLQRLLSFILLPLTLVYCVIVLFKRFGVTPKRFDIPIISIGNLTLGGSGKTPTTVALAEEYEQVAIILRGYKRASQGLHVVSLWGEIQCDVTISGDEAMLYASLLPKALVIVSEKREEGIIKAQKLGARIVFLDDGFSKAHIQKLDILIRPMPEPINPFCLPSGPYREPKFLYKNADLVIEEGKDFHRKTSISNPTEKMVLVTAIANPVRLDPYLPYVVGRECYPDHHAFTQQELEKALHTHQATSILTTRKDAVKMEQFNLPLSILELKLDVALHVKEKITAFTKDYIVP